MLEFICVYIIITIVTLVILACAAGKNAKSSDLWIGAVAWPITVAKLVEHIIKD
jgi:hypothetical protein